MQQLISKSGSVDATLTRLLSVVFAVVLVSCGGGSGSGNNPTYTVGGTISGLASGKSVELDLLVAGAHAAFNNVDKDGLFRFAERLSTDDVYDIRVSTQPIGQTCTVSNGSGKIATSNVTGITIACSTSGQFAYVVNEGTNEVSMYAINASTGLLTALSPSTITTGDASYPESISINPAGSFAYVTNYGSRTVSMYAINASTGLLTALSPSTISTNSPYSVAINPAGSFAYVVNGASNTVSMYAINASTGILTPLSTPDITTGSPDSNPYSIAIDSSGSFAYVTNLNGMVSMYAINASTGLLTALDPSTIDALGSLRSIAIK